MKTYTLTMNLADNRYVVATYFTNKQHSIKVLESTKISVKHPVQVSSVLDPWYVQITNGYFKHIRANNNTYEYYIPEYGLQHWSPTYPHKLQRLEVPIFIDNNTVRLKQTPLSSPIDIGTPWSIRLYIKKSIDRTDSTNETINGSGNDASENNWCYFVVNDYDRNSGLIKIGNLLDPTGLRVSTTPADNLIYSTDVLYASYYYKEEEYTYLKCNFNPLTNKNILSKGVSLYIKPAKYYNIASPSTLPTGLNSPSIEYILFDKDEKVVGGSNDTIRNFVGTLDDYYASIYYPDTPLEGGDHTLFLELARVYTAPTSTVKDLLDSVIDTRSQGNILVSNLPQDVIDKLNNNSYDMFDLYNWSEAAYPANSVVIIRLPDYVLNVAGVRPVGDALNAKMIEIRKSCKKHLAAGILPIIRFYDSTNGNLLDLQPPIDRSI
jgi:hypothetical protein